MVENLHLADEEHDYGPSKRQGAYRFLARHLKIDSDLPRGTDGSIDESFVTIESWQRMRVFDDQRPWPEDAVEPNDPLSAWPPPPAG